MATKFNLLRQALMTAQAHTRKMNASTIIDSRPQNVPHALSKATRNDGMLLQSCVTWPTRHQRLWPARSFPHSAVTSLTDNTLAHVLRMALKDFNQTDMRFKTQPVINIPVSSASETTPGDSLHPRAFPQNIGGPLSSIQATITLYTPSGLNTTPKQTPVYQRSRS